LIKYRFDTDKNRERERPLFEKIIFIGEIEDPYAREKGTRVYLLKNAKQSINAILKKEVNSKKKEQEY
jgi:hypothetical protein